MQRAWLREFNALGLQIRPDAAKLVTEFLSDCQDPQKAVEELVDGTKAYMKSKSGVVGPVIDAEVVEAVITVMTRPKDDKCKDGDAEDTQQEVQPLNLKQEVQGLDLGDGVQIYNVLTDVALYKFSQSTKVWSRSEKPPSFFAASDSKAQIYANRYHILLQRILLEGTLVPEAHATQGGVLPGQRVLTPVESLIGNPGRKLTFGLLSREHDELSRRWVIEDVHKVFSVELEVKEVAHLITDGSFVLAEGEMVDGAFKVYSLDMPAAVPRSISMEKDQIPRQAFGGSLTNEQLQLMENSESANSDGFYVVLSEVNLDSVRVLEMLTVIFQGFEAASPPTAYILMGNFCSASFVPTAEGVRNYREGFERLKFIMRSLEEHVRRGTRFIFVPGPKDPGAQTLPRAGLPDYLTSDLAVDIPGVVMATNPCRIRHFSRELVFFRHDVLRLLRQHEAVPSKQPETGPTEQTLSHHQTEMVRFLLDQAHLVPLPLEESNVIWEYDHTLRLYPLPHAVFIGGVNQPFECIYSECQFTSVGSLHRDASFYAYYPVKGTLETCDVPDRAG